MRWKLELRVNQSKFLPVIVPTLYLPINLSRRVGVEIGVALVPSRLARIDVRRRTPRNRQQQQAMHRGDRCELNQTRRAPPVTDRSLHFAGFFCRIFLLPTSESAL